MNFFKKTAIISTLTIFSILSSLPLNASTNSAEIYKNYHIMKLEKRDASNLVEEFETIDPILKNALLAGGSQNGGSFFSMCSQDDSCATTGLNDASQAMLNTFVSDEEMLVENYQYLEGLGYDGYPTYISAIYDTYTDENGDVQIKMKYVMNNIDITDKISTLNSDDFPGINIGNLQASLNKDPIPGLAYDVLSDGSINFSGVAGGNVDLDLTPSVSLDVNGNNNINIDIDESIEGLDLPNNIQDGIDAVNGDLPDSSADELGDFLFGGE